MPYILITVFLVLIIFALPGFALSKLVWTSAAGKAEKLIFGSAIGFAFSCYISVTAAYFVGWAPFVILASIIAFAIVAFGLTSVLPNFGGIDFSNNWTKGEFIACLICVCFVSFFVLLAFSRVGLATESGYRYSWLFGHDFLGRAANTVALTHGVPPPHFFFAGESLRYYILSYSIPALAYSILGSDYSIHQISMVVSFFQAILFIFVITQFFKTWFSTRIIYAILALSFFSYSFYGLFFFLKDYLVALGAPSVVLRFSWISHLFYRFFLVEPHTVMGLMIFFVVFSVMTREEFGKSLMPVLIIGFLIGIEFGIEAILGMFLVMTYGLVFLYRLPFGKMTFKRFSLIALAGAIPTAIIYSTFLAFGIFSTSGESIGLQFKLNGTLLIAFPAIAVISFGPASLSGLFGLISLFGKKVKARVDAFVIVAILTIIFMITVSHENESIFGYLKGEKILFVVLLILSGFFFQWLAGWENKRKRVAIISLLFLALPSLLSPFVDFYRISYADDVGITYVSYEDIEACNWIKHNLPRDSVVQSEPQYLGSKYPNSLIAKFAERPMAVGEWKVSGVKHDKGNREVPIRYNDIKNRLYAPPCLEEAHKIAQKYGINYIYVGPYECGIYPEHSINKWKKPNDFFRKIYDKLGVCIYEVL